MGAHDYAVLGVVALVGIAAIVSMAAAGFSSPDAPETRDFIPLTGVATSEVRYADHVPGTPPDYDFTGDGRLTIEDSYLLAQYILEQRCPPEKTCDVNGDGVLDMRDLELFNRMIESPATVQEQERVSQTRTQDAVFSPQRPSSVGSRLA